MDPLTKEDEVAVFARDSSDAVKFGLPFWLGPPSIARMGLLTRSLALLCSFLLALPSGWCCMVGAPCCHQRRPVERREDQPPPSGHKSCCCHHATKQKHNETTPAP